MFNAVAVKRGFAKDILTLSSVVSCAGLQHGERGPAGYSHWRIHRRRTKSDADKHRVQHATNSVH